MMVYLFPGHSEQCFGAIRDGVVKEFNLANCLCKKISDHLTRMKVDHFYKAIDGKTQKEYLDKRIEFTNENQKFFDHNLFIDLHFNAHPVTKANGSEVYYWKDGKDAALVVSQALGKHFRDRGAKVGNFKVLRETDVPAILIEVCFMSNDDDMKVLSRKRSVIAKDIATAIANYMESLAI